MRTLVLFTTLAIMATACDDASCLEGVCADHGETRALPGPCSIASNNSFRRCDIIYDEVDRPTSAQCTVLGRLDEDQRYDAVWTYDATTGELATFQTHDSRSDGDTRWSWEPTRVRVEFVYPDHPDRPPVAFRLFDRSLFAFDPEPTTVHVFPRPALGMLSGLEGATMVSYTWTRSGNHLTQTGPGGKTTEYELDARGRLISVGNGFITYEYDGDHLVTLSVGQQRTMYTYDAGGNVTEADTARSGGAKQIFGYDCW